MAEIAASSVEVSPSVSTASVAPSGAASRFGFKEKVFYAVGDVADGMKNTALGSFMLLYFNAVLGLSGSQAGLASSLALMVDAALDPLIGYISDNTRSRWGRRHPFMIGAAVPFALGLGLMFSIPGFGSTWTTFLYAIVVLIVLRVAYSTFVLPYAALGAELSRDYNDRSVVMTLRTFFNLVGILACQLLGYGLFFNHEGALLSYEAYVPFGWTCGAIVLISVFISWWSTRNLRHLMYVIEPSLKSAYARIFGEFRDVFRNPSFVILFVTVLTFWVSQGAAAMLGNHTFLYFWGLPSGVITYVVISGTIGGATGIPLAGILMQYLEKRDIAAAGLAIFCFCQFAPATLNVLGLMPGPGMWLYAILCSVFFVIGIVAACVGIAFGSMMMDAADEHELLFGERREGLYFAGLVFSAKAAIVGGLIFAGIGLDLIGFPQGIGTTPGVTVSPETSRDLGLMSGPGAALLSFTSVIVLMRYQLLKTKLAAIQRALAERRKPNTSL